MQRTRTARSIALALILLLGGNAFGREPGPQEQPPPPPPPAKTQQVKKKSSKKKTIIVLIAVGAAVAIVGGMVYKRLDNEGVFNR